MRESISGVHILVETAVVDSIHHQIFLFVDREHFRLKDPET